MELTSIQTMQAFGLYLMADVIDKDGEKICKSCQLAYNTMPKIRRCSLYR